jgi:hypothetical protein
MDNDDNVERFLLVFKRIAAAMEERNRLTQEDLEIFKESLEDMEVTGKPH